VAKISPRLQPLISNTAISESNGMGKGDRRTRRGKIYRGTFGKSRPKSPAKKKKKAATTATRK